MNSSTNNNMLLDFNNICRLCLHQDTDLSPIFTGNENSETAVNSLSSKILACVDIMVYAGDNMPSQICSKCVQQVDNWVKFKELCDSANSLLQQCLTNMQNSSANNNEDAEMLRKNLQCGSSINTGQLVIPDTLSDMDVSIFDQDLLFHAFDDDSHQDIWPNSEDLNTELTDTLLNTVSSKAPTNVDNTDQNRTNETNDVPSKWKVKYDSIYKSKYLCGVCSKVFSKFSHLLKHDKADHKEMVNSCMCTICNRMFVSQNRVNMHALLKHKEKSFECDVCGIKTVSQKSLKVHKQKHSGKFVCNVCGISMGGRQMLIDHLRVHTGDKPFSCNKCEAKFRTKQSLQVHYLFHNKEKMFRCHICLSMFATLDILNRHKTTHTDDRLLVCDVCGKTCKTKVILTNHKKFHSEKTFKCSTCDASFITKHLLSRHSLIHSEEKQFKCPVCDKGFNRRDSLVLHVQLHSAKTNFKCDLCDKSYILYKDLKKHVLRSHSNEKNNSGKCEVCQKTFKVIKKHKCVKQNAAPDSEPAK